MRARDDAVSAVSLPEKKTESPMTEDDHEKGKPVVDGHRSASCCDQKGAHVGGIDVGRDEACADSARQNEGQVCRA